MNTKKVCILIKKEETLKMIKSTPTFSRLSRLNLKVGENFETVNHKQFADMVRLFPLIGVHVSEL